MVRFLSRKEKSAESVQSACPVGRNDRIGDDKEILSTAQAILWNDKIRVYHVAKHIMVICVPKTNK